MSRGNALAQYHAQLGLPDKGLVIKGLIVCKSWGIKPWDQLNGLALGCYQSSPEVYSLSYFKKAAVKHSLRHEF